MLLSEPSGATQFIPRRWNGFRERPVLSETMASGATAGWMAPILCACQYQTRRFHWRSQQSWWWEHHNVLLREARLEPRDNLVLPPSVLQGHTLMGVMNRTVSVPARRHKR